MDYVIRQMINCELGSFMNRCVYIPLTKVSETEVISNVRTNTFYLRYRFIRLGERRFAVCGMQKVHVHDQLFATTIFLSECICASLSVTLCEGPLACLVHSML